MIFGKDTDVFAKTRDIRGDCSAARSAGTVTAGTVNIGALGADLPIGEIGAHLLRIAASWVTITAAACGLEHDPVSDMQRRHQLGGHEKPGLQQTTPYVSRFGENIRLCSYVS